MSYPGFQPPAGAVAPQYPPNLHPPHLPHPGSYHSPVPHTTQGPGPGHQPYPGGDANESGESGSRGNDASGRKGWGMGGWY